MARPRIVIGERKPYRHRHLGFVVDLGGWQAAANPLHVPLSGPLARAVTRGYHLSALPANRVRTAADWLLTVKPMQVLDVATDGPKPQVVKVAKADTDRLARLITRRVPLVRFAEALPAQRDDITVVLELN
jgi:hypothetical protein